MRVKLNKMRPRVGPYREAGKTVTIKLRMVCSNEKCKHEWNVEVPAEGQPLCYQCGKRGVPKKEKL